MFLCCLFVLMPFTSCKELCVNIRELDVNCRFVAARLP
ncbi:MAG: hypothetical protein AVDCRST_MAG15-1221 [uncultured Rubellimicrobium sp.]|uniref:Uncharacterized protein n=1 Tax=uncultured Rubellimicrobium sp. TaxID=543078 RepID=A0A6J4P8Q5_9RHOB|nr:MAG: hypothetical protein AVDCRST_MAG15-1221 [uncultured Rubellimicrobium sp.]